MSVDFEDLFAASPADGSDSTASTTHGTVKLRGGTGTTRQTAKTKSAVPKSAETLDSLREYKSRTGMAAVFVKTWGCSHNWSDSEYMAGLLQAEAYFVTMDECLAEDCELWLLNSCTVKSRAQNLFETELRKARALRKRIVVCGCVPQSQQKNDLWFDQVSSIGVQQIDRIAYVVSETLKGTTVSLMADRYRSKTELDTLRSAKDGSGQHLDADSDSELEAVAMSEGSENVMSITEHKRLERKLKYGSRLKAGGARLRMPKLRRNALEEIVPINSGCLNNCTYCATKHARGDLGSYTIDEIVERIRSVLAMEGVQIVNLESEDTGAYGLDIGTNIAELLTAIKERILDDESLSRNAMLRLGISNPPYFLEHRQRVAAILKHRRVFEYIHIPVQSGSNNVLYEMRRKYTVEEFNTLCGSLCDSVPGIHLCTDIIAGFPTETDADWEETMELVRKWKFETMYTSPYFPRPNTLAAKMPYVFGSNEQMAVARIKKQRVKELNALSKSFRPFEARIGTVQFFICINKLAKDGLHFIGLNKCAQRICVTAPRSDRRVADYCQQHKDCCLRGALPLDDSVLALTGKILRVKVTKGGHKYMYASVLDEFIPKLVHHSTVKNLLEFECSDPLCGCQCKKVTCFQIVKVALLKTALFLVVQLIAVFAAIFLSLYIA